MKYDDVSWHSGGDFPKGLPEEAGATHTGIFLGWALLSGLAGEIHLVDFPDGIDALQKRAVSPGKFFIKYCDGKFTNEDLNDEGNSFVQAYFDLENGQYLSDYQGVLGSGLPSLYYVADSWENLDKLKPVLDSRLASWRSSHI